MPSVTQFVANSPDEVFDVITTPTRRPQWNRVIERVIDAPERLEAGAQWVVQIRALGPAQNA